LFSGRNQSALANPGTFDPGVYDRLVHPGTDGPQPLAFAFEIGQHPAPVPFLQGIEGLGRPARRGAAQAAAEQQCKHSAIPHAFSTFLRSGALSRAEASSGVSHFPARTPAGGQLRHQH
jgi:hypothetical protein